MEIPVTEISAAETSATEILIMKVHVMEAVEEKITVEKTVWKEINAKQFAERKNMQQITAVQ